MEYCIFDGNRPCTQGCVAFNSDAKYGTTCKVVNSLVAIASKMKK